jgi:hypothetical protein
MKLQLTQYQVEKILTAINDKRIETKQAFWLGLANNIEAQVKSQSWDKNKSQ